jgi:hypothetical protein
MLSMIVGVGTVGTGGCGRLENLCYENYRRVRSCKDVAFLFDVIILKELLVTLLGMRGR